MASFRNAGVIAELLLERSSLNRVIGTVLCQFYTMLVDLWPERIPIYLLLLFVFSQPLVLLFDNFGIAIQYLISVRSVKRAVVNIGMECALLYLLLCLDLLDRLGQILLLLFQPDSPLIERNGFVFLLFS